MNDATYISSEGLVELKRELKQRKMETRREIASRIESAKELGDLSENFEYHEAKEQQAHNETRIIELEDKIRSAVIIHKKTGGQIGIGSVFSVEQNGETKRFEMVGATEANPIEGKISNETPIGQAFLGKGPGDAVEVDVPNGTVRYTILEVQ